MRAAYHWGLKPIPEGIDWLPIGNPAHIDIHAEENSYLAAEAGC